MKLISVLIFLINLHNVIKCRPIIIAHRGASGYLPEHTLESKVMAYMMNADFIEQDVVLTKDNVPIVLHDIYLDEVTDVATKYPNKKNTTTNRFYAIDFSLDEIKSLLVTERSVYPDRFPIKQSSFQISTLEEEIQLIKGLNKAFDSIYSLDTSGRLRSNRTQPGIYVELKRTDFHKSRNKTNFSEIVLDLLRKYNYTSYHDKCILQCFEAEELM